LFTTTINASPRPREGWNWKAGRPEGQKATAFDF